MPRPGPCQGHYDIPIPVGSTASIGPRPRGGELGINMTHNSGRNRNGGGTSHSTFHGRCAARSFDAAMDFFPLNIISRVSYHKS